MWTRSFIISVAADLNDLDLVTQRLLRNPYDFGELFNKFYSNEQANQFQKLLTSHLEIGADLVKNAKQGNTNNVNETRKTWYENADQIAAFLQSINIYWPQEEWKKLLYDHLDMTEKEATERLKGNYKEDIAIYDDIEQEALQMADLMSHGIIRQFNI